jgi:hypothetical protein
MRSIVSALWLSTIATVASLTLASSVLADGATITRTVQTIPFSTIANSCPLPPGGEMVQLTGTFTSERDDITNATGATESVFSASSTATGVGLTTGAQYEYQDSAHETAHLPAGTLQYPFEITYTFKAQLFSPSLGNSRAPTLTGMYHITYAANGTATADPQLFKYCLG